MKKDLNHPDNWKARHKEAMEKAKDGEHAWFKFKDDKFNCCAKCGIIQRKDGKNKPCPGVVKVTLR